jgi:cullin 3
MFNDIKISQELSNSFRNNCNLGIELNVNILTSTFWPISATKDSIILSRNLEDLLQNFRKFYGQKHSGRQLTWIHNVGTADLRAQFSEGTKDMNMSTFAMLVLVLAFNDIENAPKSFKQIQYQTGIPSPELKRALLSLSLGKYRVLNKHKKSKEITEEEEFSVNEAFSSPLKKIKILSISSSGPNSIADEMKERKETRDKVERERYYHIEAAIVRIMKSRKSLKHAVLISEVIQQLANRFDPVPAILKHSIESLIDREYLERDPNDKY